MKLSSLLLMALCLPPLLNDAVGQSKQSQFQLKQCNVANPENTPRPVFPVPSRRQMLWNETEFYAFFHYGMDTYTGKEWGDGTEDESTFAPTRVPDPAQWLRVAKQAGMKGGIAVVKHHDGFCLWPTKTTDHSVLNSATETARKTNIPRDFARAARKLKMKYGFYVSPWDRNAPSYGTGKAYDDYFVAQLTELLTQYGPVGAIWFDGVWDQDENPGFDWRLDELYGLIHTLQPACLVVNNHHLTPFEGEDVQTFERDLPGENTAGLSGQAVSRLPLETCQTMNGSWGYRITDLSYKPTDELVRYLAGAAGRGGNLLLNIGPQPDGALPAAALERLAGIGAWLRENGETIYGTQAGPVTPRAWGVTTRRGDKIYVHVLDWPDAELFVPIRGERVREAKAFADGRRLEFRQDEEGVTLRLGERPAGPDHIVELTMGK